jgi:hypothetical protein
MLALVAATVLGQAPFHYAGPMSRLLAPGAKLAPVTQGLSFEIVVTKAGGVGPDVFKLSGQRWRGSANLTFSGLKYEGGTLHGQVSFANSAGTSLQGLRLDIIGASELYRSKDKDGKEITLSRPHGLKSESPVYFGDLLDGESEGAHPIDVSGLDFKDDSIQFTLQGVLSGLRYIDKFHGPGDSAYPNMDFAAGHLYGEVYGNELFVATPPAEGKAFAQAEDQTTGLAVHPKTGDIYFTQVSNPNIFIVGPSGQKKGQIGESDGIDRFVQRLRFDKSGKLYACGDGGGNIFVIENGKVKKSIDQIADAGLAINNFDVSAEGTVWVTDGTTVRMLRASGQGAKVAGASDWHFGNLQSPFGVRVSPGGLVYVGEEEVEDKDQWDRISVFDAEGRIVRVFGRAGKNPPSSEETMHPGQVEAPREIAFGPDGMVYVSSGQGILRFQPF